MRKNLLYLYAELMGYQIPIFIELADKNNFEVYVVHDIKGKKSKFNPISYPGIKYFDKDSFTDKQLIEFALNLKPTIVYVSGWMYFKYIKTIYYLKKENIPIVSGFDDVWRNTLRQRIASYLFPYIRKRIISHAWVAGPYQFEFAKKLGFKNCEIIFNCLSADLKLFNRSFIINFDKKKLNFPHSFLYVGRFVDVKGVDLLLEAWKLIRDRKKDWTLTFIGNGPLLSEINKNKDIRVIDFLQPSELVEVLSQYGCIIVPSRREQWSIAIHEFSAAGFPIICSNECGAIPVFVINKYNGLIFNSLDINELASCMLEMINYSNEELFQMSVRSHNIGQRISPELSVNSLLSITNK